MSVMGKIMGSIRGALSKQRISQYPTPLTVYTSDLFTGGSDVAPTDLANATDRSSTTVSGESTKVMGGSGIFTDFKMDLGRRRTVSLGAKVGMRCSSGTPTLYLYIEGADTDEENSWYQATTSKASFTASTNSTVKSVSEAQITARYVRVRCNTNGAGTCHAKIYRFDVKDLDFVDS